MNASTSKIPHKIYNVGTGKNYSIWEVADMIGNKTNFIPARMAEVKETLADIDDTINDLGWHPKHDLRDKINEY